MAFPGNYGQGIGCAAGAAVGGTARPERRMERIDRTLGELASLAETVSEKANVFADRMGGALPPCEASGKVDSCEGGVVGSWQRSVDAATRSLRAALDGLERIDC